MLLVYAFCLLYLGCYTSSLFILRCCWCSNLFPLRKKKKTQREPYRSICRCRVISPATESDPHLSDAKVPWDPTSKTCVRIKSRSQKRLSNTEKSLSVALDWNEAEKTRLRSTIFHLVFQLSPADNPTTSRQHLDSNAGICCLFCIFISVQVQQSLDKGPVATVVDWLVPRDSPRWGR